MNKVITIKEENIASHFYLIRGEKIILDYDLAMLYGVETGALKQAVKRNIKRFPGRFHAYFNRRRIKQLGITKCDTIQKLSRCCKRHTSNSLPAILETSLLCSPCSLQ